MEVAYLRLPSVFSQQFSKSTEQPTKLCLNFEFRRNDLKKRKQVTY